MRGKIKGLQQQLALLNRSGQRDLTTESAFYKGWQISVDALYVLSGESTYLSIHPSIHPSG